MSIRKKGIFKGGLRYFSQMFEEEEEKEIQIGMPTDVKHVAHIGWDGPSASAPSWMNEFNSAPLEGSADAQCNKGNDDVKWVSEDKGVKAHGGSSGGPGLPKSRRTASADSLGSGDSMDRSPTSQSKAKARGRKKDKSRQKAEAPNDEAASQDPPKIPKKSRRKKSKDLDAVGDKASKRDSRNGSLFGSGTLEED